MLPLTKFNRQRAQKGLLRAVASFEIVKGIAGLAGGIFAILLLHKDAWIIAESLLSILHISTDRGVAQFVLNFADDLTNARLWLAIKLMFVYAGLRFAEGYGLWKGRTWAEWIAFGSGMLLLPWEIRELTHGVTWLRLGVFVVNLGIVVYMGFLLREERRHRRVAQSVEAES